MYINYPGHMTKMTAMVISGKPPSKSSSLEQVDFFQQNLVSGTRILQCVHKLSTCVDIDLFYGKVSLGRTLYFGYHSLKTDLKLN